MMRYTCYIIDDEQYNIDLLVAYVKETPDLELIGAELNPVVALEKYMAGELFPDITFLDVEMPEMSGIDVFKKIHDRTEVIFSTGFSDIGVYDKLGALYLLKPITYKRFQQRISQATERIQRKRLGLHQ